MVLYSIIIILLVAVDRATKILATTFLAGKGTVTVIPKVVGLHFLEGGNTGAAFGMFSGNTVWLILFTVIFIVALLYILFFKKFSSKLMTAATIMVIAGGIGNLYDRIAYGYVTDFIRFLFFEFPIFNFADTLITLGATLVIIYILIAPKDQPVFAKVAEAAEKKAEKDDDGE